MSDCNCLIHPFQNDPGTSQHQRVMDELLTGAVKIDARTMADLLDYFVQLSRHINYYDQALHVGDWQPFFRNSIPFTLAAIIKYPVTTVEDNFFLYNSLFARLPAPSGLQLTSWFIFYRFINRINRWHLTLMGSKLPVEAKLDALIRTKLQDPVKKFIQYANAAATTYGISRIDFSPLRRNEVWNLDQSDLYAVDTSFSSGTTSKFKRINNLYLDFKALFPIFLDAVKLMSAACEKDLELSLVPLTEEMQKNHPPHLALLFAFLNMFRQLQNDLNQYTRKHLDFFYREILHFIPRDASPDKAFVIFEIQRQLEKYLIRKGLKLKGGKDENKQEILFALDDEIVVNKTLVAEKRALFINNRIIYDTAYVEGVYMAPDLTMADGIDKPFTDDQAAGFPTVGRKDSKYMLPGTGVFKPYPDARLGFILASPVLRLLEGTRKVMITLQCTLDERICEEFSALATEASPGCCDGNTGNTQVDHPAYPAFLSPDKLVKEIDKALNTSYYYISETLIHELIARGIGNELIRKLRDHFLTTTKEICYCDTRVIQYENVVEASVFEKIIIPGQPEWQLIAEVIRKRKPFQLLFSGEKEWIEPSEVSEISFVDSPGGLSNQYELKFTALLNADKPAVTFFNSENLKEDLATTLPLVKIELDGHFKSLYPLDKEHAGDGCCLNRKPGQHDVPVSLYHFFRNVKVIGKIGGNPNDHSDETGIGVQVCGLRNFVVQNDESLLDVNGQITPFGSRPKIDSNFYIGSEEIFSKKWSDLFINLNWKDLPPVPSIGGVEFPGKRFEVYYNGYQDVFRNAGFSKDVVVDHKFKVQFGFLFDGKWYENGIPDCNNKNNNLLFQLKPSVIPDPPKCDLNAFAYQYHIQPGIFAGIPQKHSGLLSFLDLKRLDVNTRNYFLKLTLKCQDFQHDKYPIVLGRQLAAFAKLPELIDGAVYYGAISGGQIQQLSFDELATTIIQAFNITNLEIRPRVNALISEIVNKWGLNSFFNAVWNVVFAGIPVPAIPPPDPLPLPLPPTDSVLFNKVRELFNMLEAEKDKIRDFKDKGVVIPKEPWTPVISGISLDYMASAYAGDISLIHLYPFAGTFKHEKIESRPALFPTFCDEGSLFLGLKDLVPGNNLNVLFKLAEATADSESEKEQVFWHYLDNNAWKQLRAGFEVVEDGTRNLTTSGIIKFALPANMTKDNTVMPKGLHWIKASMAKNSKGAGETIGIHTQVIGATFTNEEANDKLRMTRPLAAGSISKMETADASVKSVVQPYESYGGSVPEIERHFYVRVSERLRHKGRAIQAFDYERLVLEAFPQIFKAKCINHSFALNAHQTVNDFPFAPGYVMLAVIPDLNKLNAGRSPEPKVPVSMIEEIETFLRKRTSPFVRFRAMNPRYEKVNFCIRVQLVSGKDENYYREKLRQDITEFLAPWAVGHYDKLTFGQCVYRSDIIRLLENTDYVDYISDLKMGPAQEMPDVKHVRICPDTPRSILIAGDIDVCIEEPGCEKWNQYEKCPDEIITNCNIKPEPIVDYCK